MRASCIVTALSLFIGCTWAYGRIISVPDDYPVIQQAIDAAADGDTVLVSPGNYSGVGNRDLDFGGRNIDLSSTDGPDVTIVDCEMLGRAFWFHSGEDSTAVVRGFTIVRGTADAGGAVRIDGYSGPRFEDCVFSGCGARSGGAIYCLSDYAQVLVRDSQFLGNTATAGAGGAVFSLLARLSIVGCSFADNGATDGGALYCGVCDYEATVAGCAFESNSAEWDGGAVLADNYVSADDRAGRSQTGSPSRWMVFVRECSFRDNTAGRLGGALCPWGWNGPFLEVESCTFTENAAQYGGAIGDEAGLFSLVGSVFSKNSADAGGAVRIRSWGPWVFRDCTFCYNQAASGAAFVCGDAGNRILSNLIIAFSQGGAAVTCPSDPPKLTRSVVFGNAAGDSVCCRMVDNLFEDPLFCDASAADFTLCANSSCLPANNGWGELVGALGEGCENCYSSVEPASWGAIKAMYR